MARQFKVKPGLFFPLQMYTARGHVCGIYGRSENRKGGRAEYIVGNVFYQSNTTSVFQSISNNYTLLLSHLSAYKILNKN
jgi:hypothetical protein